ncbi:hypothetical protein CQW23_33839 [Capsicum baccatum]|uniref:Uncharacterized protein n=1 Tax=Capsicum baccatum TaxID=33114 RepID=A0A2G2V0N9_CAPBA|nr:hypothetical protein CQW23_33839 [Capsicum baccatum]
MGREGQAIDSSIPWRFPRWGSLVARRGRGEALVRSAGAPRPCGAPQLLNTFAGSFCCAGFDNDPSAGSPTETLLRLLLPLNDKVSTMILSQVHLRKPCYDFSFLKMIRFNGLVEMSRAANRPRCRDPNISSDHSIGTSDGRCVQRAGT